MLQIWNNELWQENFPMTHRFLPMVPGKVDKLLYGGLGAVGVRLSMVGEIVSFARELELLHKTVCLQNKIGKVIPPPFHKNKLY